MTDLIYDYITMGVDMMISAAILTSVVVLLRSSTILSTYSAQQQATSDRLNYYREYAMYDCTENLLSPDVLSAITYYRYDLAITIQMGSNIISNFYISPYGTESITGKYYLNGEEVDRETVVNMLGTDKQFSSLLWEDFQKDGASGYTFSTSGYTGGLITGIKFTQQ